MRQQALEHSIQRADGQIFVRRRTSRHYYTSTKSHSPPKAFNFSQFQQASFVMTTESAVTKASPGILRKISRDRVEGSLATPLSTHTTSTPITSTPTVLGPPSHREHSVVMVVPSLVETPHEDSVSSQSHAMFEPAQEAEAERHEPSNL